VRESLSLVLMCSLASPAMAVAQDTDEAYTRDDPAEGERPFLDGLYWQLLVSGFYMFNGYRVSGVYTRGALYFLRQPFNHMGVRLGAELAKIVGFMFMLTNGGVGGGGENIYFSRSSVEDANDIVEPDKDIYGGIILGATAHIGN